MPSFPSKLLSLFRKDPSWKPFLDRYPRDWTTAYEAMLRAERTAPSEVKEVREKRAALTYAALTEVTGEDVAAFFKEFTVYHSKPLDPDDPSPSEIAAKIHAFSAQERTAFYINGLRGWKLLRLLSIDTLEYTEKSRIEAFLSHREILDVTYLKVDHLAYPPYLNGGSARHFDTNQIAYALSAVAKGKMDVSEDLATELLQHLPHPQTQKTLFSKGLAKHLVLPYRQSPSAAYRQAFDAALTYLNDNHHGFGRQSQSADFKHYLRQLMNNAVRKNK